MSWLMNRSIHKIRHTRRLISKRRTAALEKKVLASQWLSEDMLWGPLAASLIGAGAGASATWLSGIMGKMLFRREAMGFGDVKFMALLGGFLGWKLILLVFFLASVFGSVVGLVHLLRTRDHHIPYGPFLSMGTLIAILWADKIFSAVGVTALLASGP